MRRDRQGYANEVLPKELLWIFEPWSGFVESHNFILTDGSDEW